MTNYFDLHCHLLPDVDDGPATMADALALAQALVQQGFSTVVATPHYLEDFSQRYQAQIKQQYQLLCEALQEAGVPLHVVLGGEILLTPVLLDLAPQELPFIAGTKSLLLELPLYQALPSYTEQVLFQLQLQGCQPIIAHPERCQALQSDPASLQTLVQLGCLVQVNFTSLSGLYGKRVQRTAKQLLNDGMAHFLASDSHHVKQLQKANLQSLAKQYPLQLLLQETPKALLNNEPVKRMSQNRTPLAALKKLFRL